MGDQEPTKCPVCLIRFNTRDETPKLFPTCGHTICKKCLYQVLRNYTSKCPLDKIPFDRELRSVDSFPTNLIALNLIQNNERYPKCKNHPEEREKVMCMTDDKLICTDCVILGDHKDHEIKSLTEAQECAQIKKNQLQEIFDKIQTNVSEFDKSIQEKEKNIKEVIKQRFSCFYEAIKKHETQMLSELESMLREEKARAKNPRLHDRASEIKTKLSKFSSLISSPQFMFMSTHEVVKLIEEDFVELEKTVAKELTFSSQKIEEFTSLLAVFENSLPKKDLLKELSIEILDQNLAEWNDKRTSSLEESKEVILSSALSLQFKGDKLLEVWEGNYYSRPKEDFAYDKSKLDKVEELSYGCSVDDEKEKDILLPAIRKVSKSLPNAKSVTFNFDLHNGQKIHSNERFRETLANTLSQPEHIEKLKFSFANYFVGDLGFLFLAETVLPKIKNLASFCIKMEEPVVSGQVLTALAQVNWRAWPNLEELRFDIPQPSFKESEILQLLNALPNTKRLSLGFANTQLTDQALENFSTNILPSLDKLERFEVGFWNTKLTSVGAEKLLMNLPNINRLLVGLDRTGITEDVIRLFLDKKLPTLKLREFQFGVSDDDLSEDIVQQLDDLECKINEGLDDWKDVYSMNFRSWHKTWRYLKADNKKKDAIGRKKFQERWLKRKNEEL